MRRHHGLVNRRAVRSKFASARFRTSQDVLDHLEALVATALKAGIKGMVGRARKTVTVEEVERGRLLGDPTKSVEGRGPTNHRRKVNRGLLRR